MDITFESHQNNIPYHIYRSAEADILNPDQADAWML